MVQGSPRRLALRAVGFFLVIVASSEGAVRARLFFRDPHRWDENGLFRYRAHCQVRDTLEVDNEHPRVFRG